HEIPRFVHDRVDTLRSSGPVDSVLLKGSDGVRVNGGPRLHAGAPGLEPPGPFLDEQGLGDLAPRRVAGTEKEQAQWCTRGMIAIAFPTDEAKVTRALSHRVPPRVLSRVRP